jgi:hypothetical protein
MNLFENISHLCEMAVLCAKKQDEPFIIWIGGGPHSNFSEGGQSEHNPPHIHVKLKDSTFETRVRIDSKKIPTSIDDIKYVKGDMLLSNKVAKDLVSWLNKPPKALQGINNWNAARTYWEYALQDDANEGQSEPIFLNKKGEQDE